MSAPHSVDDEHSAPPRTMRPTAGAAVNASVLAAARDGMRAIGAWLEQHGDRGIQRAKTEHDQALCALVLGLLAQPAAIPSGVEFSGRVVLPAAQAEPDEEWYEVTHWWELYVRAERIICNEYTNLATIISAGQTPIRELRSTDTETAVQREHLAAWRAGLDKALLAPNVSVDVARLPV